MFKRILTRFRGRNEEYHKPSLLGCIIGVFLGAILIFFLSFFISGFSFLMALLSGVFLAIPNQLDWLPKITKADVITLTVPQEGEFELTKPGQYTIFSPELLLIKYRTKYGVILQLKDTGEQVEVNPILDGTSRFGAELVEGLPIFGFYVKQAGRYKITIQNLDTGAVSNFILSIVPDYSTQYQTAFSLSCLTFGAIIGGIVWVIYKRRSRPRRETEKAAKQEKLDKFEEWLKKEKESRTENKD
jgi:hypothetical protein